MKGCPLRCHWCSSPYTQKSEPEILHIRNKCIACGACLDERCPVGAIGMKMYDEFDDERSFTDVEKCIGCGLYVLSCPTEARTMKLVRPPEHIQEPASMFDDAKKD